MWKKSYSDFRVDKAFKDNKMVNRALTSLNGGSFEIALTVPLSPRKFKEQGVYIDKIFDYYGL